MALSVNFILKTGCSGQREAFSKFMGPSSHEKGNKPVESLGEPGRLHVPSKAVRGSVPLGIGLRHAAGTCFSCIVHFRKRNGNIIMYFGAYVDSSHALAQVNSHTS